MYNIAKVSYHSLIYHLSPKRSSNLLRVVKVYVFQYSLEENIELHTTSEPSNTWSNGLMVQQFGSHFLFEKAETSGKPAL